MLTVGWVSFFAILIHTLIFLWESFAAASIISNIWKLKESEKIINTTLIIAVWIGICGILWR